MRKAPKGISSVLGLALLACPQAPKEQEQPQTPPPEPEAPASQPASQPSSQPDLPPGHSVDGKPVELDGVFAMPETGPVIAKVGDTEIKREQLETKLRQLRLQLEAAGMPDLRRKDVLKAAVDQLVDVELIFQVADEMDIKIDDKEVNNIVAEIETRAAANPAMKAMLERAKNTPEQRRFDARFQIANREVRARLQARIMGRPEINEKMKDYYNRNQKQFLERAGTEAWRLFIKAPGGLNQRERDLARSRVDEALEEAKKNPGNFENLVMSKSEGGKSASGGYLGYVAKGTFQPDLEKELFSAKPGSILPVHEDANGFYIYKVGKSRQERTKPFEEVKVEVFRRIIGGLMEKELDAEMKELRDAKSVEVMVPELEEDKTGDKKTETPKAPAQ